MSKPVANHGRRLATASLAVLILAMSDTPTLAQSVPAPAAVVPPIVPPGDGMLDQPCAQTRIIEPRQLPEPGNPVTFSSELTANSAANKAYTLRYDWPWLCRYKAENAALAGSRPAVVFLGDSITELWRLYDSSFFGARNVNRGISGQTSPQMLLRFYQDVIALHPRVVHILAGTNDIAGNTGPTSAVAFQNNVRAMVELAQANGIAVVIGSVPPAATFAWAPKLHPAEQIPALNAWLKAYAAQRHAVYADYYSVLVDRGTGGMTPAFTFDGVHPASLGYRKMRPVAERAIAAAEHLAGK